jgi:hypothetical protein
MATLRSWGWGIASTQPWNPRCRCKKRHPFAFVVLLGAKHQNIDLWFMWSYTIIDNLRDSRMCFPELLGKISRLPQMNWLRSFDQIWTSNSLMNRNISSWPHIESTRHKPNFSCYNAAAFPRIIVVSKVSIERIIVTQIWCCWIMT